MSRANPGVEIPSQSTMDEVRRLLSLAFPAVIAHLGGMLMGVVDVAMVGQLGEVALAQTSMGHTYSFALLLPILGLAIGLDPLFAQAFGAHDRQAVARTLRGGLAIVGLACIPAVLIQLQPVWVLRAMGQTELVVEGATPYILIRTLAIPGFAAFAVFRQYAQAAGRMWPGTVAVIVGNVVNVVANAILIYGLLGVPALGVVGAGWATVCSNTAMVAVLLGIVFWDRELRPNWALAKRDWRLGRLVTVAGPVGLQVGLEGWGFSIATVLVGTFGETWLAANAVALTLASLAFMVPLGISSAAATRVGNLLGAGHGWRRSAWISIAMGASVMMVFSALFSLMPGVLAWPFVESEAAIAAAIVLLPIAAGFALFDGVQVVTFGVLRGAGDTTVPAIANVVGYYVIGLPIGAWLAYTAGFGAAGVWMGLAIALACVAVMLLIRLVWTIRRGGFLVVEPSRPLTEP